MPFIIDGHNLIPKIPGLDLEVVDDEMQLVELLQEFCRITRKKVDVYFDNAPPGSARLRHFGSVTAHFTRQGYSADQAIQGKLKQLKRAAANWTVVSSDHEVQSNARTLHARVISSEQFAADLMEILSRKDKEQPENELPDPSMGDLREWYRLFGIDE
ncbi:MAG: NYN domain-containing protein [Anaerolineales bacterium]